MYATYATTQGPHMQSYLSVTVSGLTIEYLSVYVYLSNELHSYILYF